ncbi:transporter substrate-binding domain-containing protein [Trinickia mobilis]|uniref:transporter substrate-binding domain-containing protein n=1 Tax=Trinickia mobilis TaxID=2816356 RepID=UPI001A8E1AD4|nr:transporter substrate-binding domain-containing protein [Trinickia mobilis]
MGQNKLSSRESPSASYSIKDVGAAPNELAAVGKLRVGVVFAPAASTYFVVKRDDGEPCGVTVDLGRALAKAADVPVEFFATPNSGELTDAVENELIDVAFVPIDDERRRRVAFGPAYFNAESTCLVQGNSEFKSVLDLNRPEVRVAGISNTTTIRSAVRVLHLSTIMPVSSIGEAIDMLCSGRVDAVALSRDVLAAYQPRIVGSRLLDGSLHATGIAIAIPKGRPLALAYVRAFLDNAKASGLIRRVFDLNGFEAEPVAPIDSAT